MSSPPQSGTPERPRRRPPSLRRVALLLLAATSVPTLMGFAARLWWVCELATHFRAQSALAMLPLLVWCVAAKHWLWALAPAALIGVNLAYIVPLYLPFTRPPAAGETHRALLANVLTSNDDTERILRLIERERPDFVVLIEVDHGWLEALRPLADEYPHRVVHPRGDNFGIALYSRRPIVDSAVHDLGGADVPTIAARIDAGGRELTVIGTHPLPPVNAEYAALRNRHLAALGELAARSPRPVLVLGDLNCTSGSPYFGDLLSAGSLRDTRRGYGLQPTWPEQNPLLRIPIDHALASDGLTVLDRRIGPDIGSDHRPVILDFAFADP